MTEHTTRVVLKNGGIHRVGRNTDLTIYPKGLVSYYPLEGDTSNLIDESKNDNDGQIKGGKRVDGIAGKALELKQSDYARVYAKSDFNMGVRGFSISIFFKPLSLVDGRLLHKIDDDAGYEISVENRKVRSDIKGSRGKSGLESNTRVSKNEFYLITLVRGSGGFGKLYINGNKEAEIASEYDVNSPSDLMIGDRSGNGIHGVVDEIYFYRYGLPSRLVNNIYEKYIGP